MVEFHHDEKYSEPPYDLRCTDVLNAEILDYIRIAMVTFTFQMKAAVEERRASNDKLHTVAETYNILLQYVDLFLFSRFIFQEKMMTTTK